MAEPTALSPLARVLLPWSPMMNVHCLSPKSNLPKSKPAFHVGLLALALFALNLTVACAPKSGATAAQTAAATPAVTTQDRAVAASGPSAESSAPTAPEATLTPTVVTATADDKDKPECEGSHAEEAECTLIHIGLAQAELKLVVDSLQKRLAHDSKSRDQLTRETAIEIKKRLDKSQRAWTQFRQSDCSLESSEMLGGNREDLALNSCLLERTRDRIRVLKELAI